MKRWVLFALLLGLLLVNVSPVLAAESGPQTGSRLAPRWFTCHSEDLSLNKEAGCKARFLNY